MALSDFITSQVNKTPDFQLSFDFDLPPKAQDNFTLLVLPMEYIPVYLDSYNPDSAEFH